MRQWVQFVVLQMRKWLQIVFDGAIDASGGPQSGHKGFFEAEIIRKLFVRHVFSVQEA
jgi:hypothetical protein